MKTKFIASTLIALATIASSSAFASLSYGTGDADPVENTPTLSKLTRAEVSSDTAAWNKTHYSANLESVVFADVEAVPATTFVSKVSRNDIKTETALWNKKHYFENLESATVIDRN